MAVSTAAQQASDGNISSCERRGAHRPIDLVHLSKYTLGNRSLENELLGLFRNQADVYFARLAAAADDSEWKNAAHSLKGSARGLGAWALAELAEEAEKLLAAAEGRAAIMERIRDAILSVNAFIDSVADA